MSHANESYNSNVTHQNGAHQSKKKNRCVVLDREIWLRDQGNRLIGRCYTCDIQLEFREAQYAQRAARGSAHFTETDYRAVCRSCYAECDGHDVEAMKQRVDRIHGRAYKNQIWKLQDQVDMDTDDRPPFLADWQLSKIPWIKRAEFVRGHSRTFNGDMLNRQTVEHILSKDIGQWLDAYRHIRDYKQDEYVRVGFVGQQCIIRY